MAADSNGMQRFLIFKHAKAQWTKWQSSLAWRLRHQKKESHHEQEQVHAIGSDNAQKLDGKAAVIHGIASAFAPHSGNHVPNAPSGSNAMNTSSQQHRYEIRFQSLYNEGRALTFPCDAQGHVEMDALSETARMNYLYARAVVGRDYAAPAVLEADLH
jgi:hypothetical protein